METKKGDGSIAKQKEQDQQIKAMNAENDTSSERGFSTDQRIEIENQVFRSN